MNRTMKALMFLGAALSFSAVGAFLGEKIWLGALVFLCIAVYAGQTFLKLLTASTKHSGEEERAQ